LSPASRSRRSAGGHHHPGHGEGEAPGGQGRRGRKGKVNEDGKRTALDVQAGDRILFGKYSGNEVRIEDDEYVIMREEDVFAILA